MNVAWTDSTPRPAWQQMALDRAAVDVAFETGTAIYRLYRWRVPSISLGANEAALRTWSSDAITRARVEVVRRPTGGRGVWHDPADLTYAVASPLHIFGTLRDAYASIHRQLCQAFNRLGVAASIAPSLRRPTLEPGACFDVAIGGEVMAGNRKLIGTAQAMFGTAMLQHGAIALADRLPALSGFRIGAATTDNARFAEPVAPAERAADAVLAAWHACGIATASDAIIGEVVERSAHYTAHFQDPGWTWRR